ncbi:MAG: hypothetical protein RJQ00_06585 [Vicingaceae bacterium]
MSTEETLTIYHHGDMNFVNQILALAKSDKIKTIEKNISDEKLSGTKMLQLSNKMNTNIKGLVNKKSSLYNENLKNGRYDEADWIAILTDHPLLIKTPIAETKKDILFIETPSDVLKLKNIDKSIDAYQHGKNNHSN